MRVVLQDFLKNQNIAFERNVKLSSKTWIRTGGICSYWIVPFSITQLKTICSFLNENHLPYEVVGNTSNIFFHSTYTPYAVVSTLKVNKYSQVGDCLICECGVNVIKLAKTYLEKGYAGFYGLVGLPGTVGASIVNNSGCFDCSISSMLVSAEVLLPDGSIKTFSKDDFGYSKRSSIFKRSEVKGVILSANLKLQKSGSVAEEYKKAEYTKLFRKEYQEGYVKNLGSIFKRKKIRANVRNVISTIAVRIVSVMGLSKPARIRRQVLLWLYGYKDIKKYVSEKNINIFVWGDEYAEDAFEKYKQFMSRVYKDLEIEIEEKL